MNPDMLKILLMQRSQSASALLRLVVQDIDHRRDGALSFGIKEEIERFLDLDAQITPLIDAELKKA